MLNVRIYATITPTMRLMKFALKSALQDDPCPRHSLPEVCLMYCNLKNSLTEDKKSKLSSASIHGSVSGRAIDGSLIHELHSK
ncbi:unnamed protein product [Gongylonema pulchrum]|uniref:Uncharacterized protein n=1 Tax=Gongylonema pulchrum TaxID=637853 RepID=A0A183CWN3_9BILA|nr:unnamed protein product [Gongylonema pulchrum]